MPISDHYAGGMTERLAVQIVTVDTANGRIEAVGKDAAVIQIGITRVPPLFVWPNEGELWTIRRENGEWALDAKVPTPDNFSSKTFGPGTGLVQADHLYLSTGQRLVEIADLENVSADGVYVGTSAPTDTSVLWVDTDDFDNDTDARLDALEAKLNPDFDSGWLADNNLTNGVRTYTHNLGLLGPPNSFKLWFSPDQLIWYPVGENRGMGTNEMAASTAANYHNPGLVSVSANIVEVSVYVPVGGGGSTSMPIYSGYTGTGWRNYASGYWRYKIWR